MFACLLAGQDESHPRMPSIHPIHVIPVHTGMGTEQGTGSPAPFPACRKLPYWRAKPAELQPRQMDRHARRGHPRLSLALMKVQNSQEPQLCATEVGRRGIASSQAELWDFSMQENKEKRRNASPNLYLIPAGRVLPSWLNPQSSPAPCHCARRLGDTLAVSPGWEEMRATCPQ